MNKRDSLTKIVQSTTFKRIAVLLSIFLIGCTFFIAVQPDSFIRLGYFGVFIYNILGSGIFIIPVLSTKLNIFWLIFFSSLGNVINTSVAYILGHSTHSLFPKVELIAKIKKFMRHYHLIGLYIVTIIPFPIDIAGLLSGYLQIPYPLYVLINFLGKSTLFALIALGIIAIQH